MSNGKVWQDEPPKHCDLCSEPITTEFFDAKLRQGAWGHICPPCFAEQGIGLGRGKGQQYRRDGDHFVCVAGDST